MAINILDEMHSDFLVYAQEVNQNRAFPDARDGLKPSQRAALYTMYRKGWNSSKPHVKSAKISGAVIGELWPHGDAGAYETFVRMSQDWLNNISEVDFHGANGSLLGGPQAASSRYTEARLSKAAEEGLFANFKYNVVDMIPNYAEDDEWPLVLPAIMPRLFVNGSSGIGYTIAQTWLPGNLKEFTERVKSFIKSGKVDCKGIYPDFPTGGIIINKDEVHNIYETGKGSITLRGKVDISGNVISITELPPQVYAEDFITKIKNLVNEGKLDGIEDICNKSGDDGLLIEIECRGSKLDAGIVLHKLYRLTDLQVSLSANQMALINGEPKLLTLKDYISIYINHNEECILKEFTEKKLSAEKRLEIVEGLVKALSIIDDVIKTIKASKNTTEAKEKLVNEFKFTPNQAQAVVDMRLGKLTHLEIAELTDEKITLDADIKYFNSIIVDKNNRLGLIVLRLTEFTKSYGWERRTQVDNISIVKEKAEVKAIAPKIAKEYFITLTKDNVLKRIELSQFKMPKDGSVINAIKLSNKDKVIMITDGGVMFKEYVSKIPLCTMNSGGLDLTDKGNVLNIYSGSETEAYMIMATSKGRAKKMNSGDVFGIGKNSGAVVMKLEDEHIIDIKLIDKGVYTVMYNNNEYKINSDKLKAKGRSAGGVNAFKIK